MQKHQLENARRVKILKSGEWIEINPLDIKRGMSFRIFERDGTPVTFCSGNTSIAPVYNASSDAYINTDGIICVNVL